jgi:hypothetical protein
LGCYKNGLSTIFFRNTGAVSHLSMLNSLHKTYAAWTLIILVAIVGVSLSDATVASAVSEAEVALSNRLLPIPFLLALVAIDEVFKSSALTQAARVLSKPDKDARHEAWRRAYRLSQHATALRWSITSTLLVGAALSLWYKLNHNHEIEPVLTGLYGLILLVTTLVPVSSGADARTRLFKIDAHLSRKFSERQSMGQALSLVDQTIQARRARPKK